MSETEREACLKSLTRVAFVSLASNPGHQAKAIAQHYVAHARVAQHVLELLDHPATPDRDQAINMLINAIKKNHAYDLGIELEWPKTEL